MPKRLRGDVLEAVALNLGYSVSHRNGNRNNAASFDLADRSVWMADSGWQARSLDPTKGFFGPRRVYGWRGNSLAMALLAEAPPKIAGPKSGT